MEVNTMELCKKYMSLYESLPKWLKVVLVILWGIPSNLYRLAKSVVAKNVLYIVLAVVLLICGGFFILLIVDIITLVTKDKIYWLDDIH